jgi:hypothetical protein
MAILAIVLLRLPGCTPQPEPSVRVEPLTDAVLLHTTASFGSDPEDLGALLQRSLGAQLEEHEDARGIFVLPSVAVPSARSYDAVIAEVGEGGMWIPQPSDAGGAYALPDGLGALGAVLGSMLQHMPQSVLDAASAAARGDMGGLSQVSDQVASLLGQEPHGAPDMASLTRLVAGGGLDFSSPMFQQLLGGLQQELARDPEKMQRLAEQLFGALPGSDPDDDK